MKYKLGTNSSSNSHEPLLVNDSTDANLLKINDDGDTYLVGVGDYDGTNDGTTGILTLQEAIAACESGTAGTLSASATAVSVPTDPLSLSGSITLHEVAWTGDYGDLENAIDDNDLVHRTSADSGDITVSKTFSNADIILKGNTSGNTPVVSFQAGTSSDTYPDWKIYGYTPSSSVSTNSSLKFDRVSGGTTLNILELTQNYVSTNKALRLNAPTSDYLPVSINLDTKYNNQTEYRGMIWMADTTNTRSVVVDGIFTPDNSNAQYDEVAASKGYVDGKVSSVPEYSIALASTSTGAFKSYKLQKGGSDISGSLVIDIPKDFLVKSGSVVDVVLYNGHYYESTDTGHTTQLDDYGVNSTGKYIKLVVNSYDSSTSTGDTYLYIAAQDLIDVYNDGDGIDIDSSNNVNINLDTSNANGLGFNSDTPKKLKLDLVVAPDPEHSVAGSAGAMSAADKAKLDGIEAGAQVNVQSDWEETTDSEPEYIVNKPPIKKGTGVSSSTGENVSVVACDITGNIASGPYSLAEGGSNIAYGNYSHAEGNNTLTYGRNSHAEGYGVAMSAYADTPFTLTATGVDPTMYDLDSADAAYPGMLLYNPSNGKYCRVSTVRNNATTKRIVVDYSIGALSAQTVKMIQSGSVGNASHTEGFGNYAASDYGHAEGRGTITRNISEHAQGQFNVSNQENRNWGYSGNTIHSIGIGSSDSDRLNAVEVMQFGAVYVKGIGNYNGTNFGATGVNSLQQVVNAASAAAVQADWTEETSTQPDYIQNRPDVRSGTGIGSIIEGNVDEGSSTRNIASGTYSHAGGTNTTASGSYSNAQGSGTLAAGVNSHAEGSGGSIVAPFKLSGNANATTYTTNASSQVKPGMYISIESGTRGVPVARVESISGATVTTNVTLDSENAITYSDNICLICGALSEESHSEGTNCIALGSNSHAEGTAIRAYNDSEHSQGKYNRSNASTIFSIGVGTGNEEANRKNAIEVTSSGNVYIMGIGGYNGQNTGTQGVNTIQQATSNFVTLTGEQVIRGKKSFISDVDIWNGGEDDNETRTPALVFRRGTERDRAIDWKILNDNKGQLQFIYSERETDTEIITVSTSTGVSMVCDLGVSRGITAEGDIYSTSGHIISSNGHVSAGTYLSAGSYITAATNITAGGKFIGLLKDGTGVGSGNDYYIMSLTNHSLTTAGTTGDGYRSEDTRPVTSANVVNYVDNAISGITSPTSCYWANLSVQSDASYITTPEIKQVTINGSTTNQVSTDHCVITYDTTNKCLKFTF